MFNLKNDIEMKKTLIFAASAAVALIACNKEEISSPQENLVYREFKAVIAEGTSTKVSFGEPDAGKIPAYFDNGDEIALTDGTTTYKATVVKNEGTETTLGGDMATDFKPTEAYYPYSSYNQSTKKQTVPGRQYADTVAVLLKSIEIADDMITFSAADTKAAMVHFSLTGDVELREVRLHINNSNASVDRNPKYTISYTSQYHSSPVQLSESPFDVYFAVDAAEAGTDNFLALEIKLNNIAEADSSIFRRKISSVDLSEGKFVDMPVIDLKKEQIVADAKIWKFGSANDGDCGWSAEQAGGSIDGSTYENYALVTMASVNIDEKKEPDVDYKFQTNIRYTEGFTVNCGTYRYMAIMSDMKHIVRDNVDGKINIEVPEGADVTRGNITFDTSMLGGYNGGGSNKWAGVKATNIENVEVLYFDMLTKFSRDNGYVNTLASHTFTPNFTIKVADLKVSDVPDGSSVENPQYKVYWIGFFHRLSDINEMIAATEAAEGVSDETLTE